MNIKNIIKEILNLRGEDIPYFVKSYNIKISVLGISDDLKTTVEAVVDYGASFPDARERVEKIFIHLFKRGWKKNGEIIAYPSKLNTPFMAMMQKGDGLFLTITIYNI